MAFGANKLKPKLNKLTRPNDWPPPEEGTEKEWEYELLSESAYSITRKLNFYKERNYLRSILSMTATDNTVTVLLEVYCR